MTRRSPQARPEGVGPVGGVGLDGPVLTIATVNVIAYRTVPSEMSNWPLTMRIVTIVVPAPPAASKDAFTILAR